MSKTHNLFISHSWSYTNAYDLLVALLDDASYFSYRNYSVPKNDPIHNAPNATALYQAIANKISLCHVVIVMGGKYSTYSTWINNEIKIANSQFTNPKPILAITPFGAKQISSVVKDNADLVVAWNTKSIVKGIRDLSPL